MNIVVFDTETTSLEKPFCYNIGYAIYNTEQDKILYEDEFVVEQIWHNRELFTTAYYADKRDIYIRRMKGKSCIMEKMGYITKRMAKLFKDFDVVAGFAYNSPFDEKVFDFCCEWFKVQNPFDTIPIYDIRGYVHNSIAFTSDYKKFCEDNAYFTESGNYSTTAETVFRYLAKDTTFLEEHTALADTEIELEILKECIKRGSEWNKSYKVYSTIPRKVEKTLIVRDVDKIEHSFPYDKILIRKEKDAKTKIYLSKRVDKSTTT